MLRSYSHGFTLIELITVIILIAILSLSASSYITGVSSVSVHTLQSELLHSLRLTQTRSMNRNGYCNRWLIDEHRAQQISIKSTSTCSSSFPEQQPSDAYLENQDSTYVAILAKHNASFSLQIQSQTNNLTTPYAFNFDNLGRINECKLSGCTINIIGNTQKNICIEKEGYIHAC